MTLHSQAERHADVLHHWMNALESATLGHSPARSALVCVDLIEGFTREGALASPRVTGIIPNVTGLMRRLLDWGLPAHNVVLVQDHHPESAEEFRAYPPHAVAGTSEAQAVREVRELPEFPLFRHFQKNSIASHTSPEFLAWLESADVDTLIAVGDVTDLCLYTLALHLVTFGMARGKGWRVVVPENCVQTWDAPDHPGDLYHALFLHQLARNGVEVVKTLRV